MAVLAALAAVVVPMMTRALQAVAILVAVPVVRTAIPAVVVRLTMVLARAMPMGSTIPMAIS